MVLAAFLVGLALWLGGTAFVVVRGIGLWRVAKRVGGVFGDELGRFEERTARTERLLAESERASRDLEVALARLRVSRARLAVLRSELERSQERVRWVRAFLPL